MIIDFDDIKTYPYEIVKYANDNDFDDFDKVNYNVDYPFYFDDLLNKYKLFVYHCTRTKNILNYKKYGVLLPSDERLKKILLEDTNGCNLNEFKSFELGRGGDIQFTFSLNEICNDKQFLDFFNNVGGEIVRFVSGYNENELKKIGDCYIIKFFIEGSEIKYKRFLIQKMIRKVKYDINVDYYDGVTHNILTSQICDYIPANDIYKLLKEMV